jgi:antitoxin ParD1/3/4
MATMNVSLPVEMVDFVETELSQGRYASSSEMICDALRLLQHDKALEREKLAILRREINIGLDAASAGRFSVKSVSDIADEVRREHSGG